MKALARDFASASMHAVAVHAAAVGSLWLGLDLGERRQLEILALEHPEPGFDGEPSEDQIGAVLSYGGAGFLIALAVVLTSAALWSSAGDAGRRRAQALIVVSVAQVAFLDYWNAAGVVVPAGLGLACLIAGVPEAAAGVAVLVRWQIFRK